VGRGTWVVGRGSWDVGRGTWVVGRGTWDVGRGTWDVGRETTVCFPRRSGSGAAENDPSCAPSRQARDVPGFSWRASTGFTWWCSTASNADRADDSRDQADRSSRGRAPCVGTPLLSIHDPKVFCGCGGEIHCTGATFLSIHTPQSSCFLAAAPRSVRERERSFGPASEASTPVVGIRSIRAVIRPIRVRGSRAPAHEAVHDRYPLAVTPVRTTSYRSCRSMKSRPRSRRVSIAYPSHSA
jgi:hypothetical protein